MDILDPVPEKCIYTEEMLPVTYAWLHNNEIKELTNTPDFSKEDQEKWFRSIQKDKTYIIWVICLKGKPIGVFGIKNILNSKGEYWGFIGEKEYWGKGIGRWMVDEVINYSKKIGLKKVYLHVLDSNIRAFELYKKKGFYVIHSENELVKMEKIIL